MSDLTERPPHLRPHDHPRCDVCVANEDRIDTLEAALRVIAEECVSTGGEFWMGTAEIPSVFQEIVDHAAIERYEERGGDSDE